MPSREIVDQKDALSCGNKVDISPSKASAYNLLLDPNPSFQFLSLISNKVILVAYLDGKSVLHGGT